MSRVQENVRFIYLLPLSVFLNFFLPHSICHRGGLASLLCIEQVGRPVFCQFFVSGILLSLYSFIIEEALFIGGEHISFYFLPAEAFWT